MNHPQLGRSLLLIVSLVCVTILVAISVDSVYPDAQSLIPFDGQRALDLVDRQVAMGSRIPGSQAHAEVIDLIQAELGTVGWHTSIQNGKVRGHSIQNVIASRSMEPPHLIIGAHYDSRSRADQDPDPNKSTLPVPGANDGASGVALLLELARTLPEDDSSTWLVFFDAEDNGQIPGWDWEMGSSYFVDQLQNIPDAVIILDMIGDADLNIYMEKNSDPILSSEIWKQAADLGYSDAFIALPRYSILDDHVPFLNADIPAVLVIDFDYPFWHSTQDTTDKISSQSLAIVGNTLWNWIVDQNRIVK